MMSDAFFLGLCAIFWSIGETSRWEWVKNMLVSAVGIVIGHVARALIHWALV